VLDQSAAAGMMIIPRRRRAPKPVAELIQEHVAQALQTWIRNRLHRFSNEFEIGFLFFVQLARSLQQFVFFLWRQRTQRPLFGVEAVLRVRAKFSSQLDETFSVQSAARFVSRMIVPNSQQHSIASIGQT